GGSDPAALGQVPAVRLFLERVRRVRPDFALTAADAPAVADICRRLDGVPSALQAAASWLVVYDLPTLHRCLHDDPASLLYHLAGPDGDSGLRGAPTSGSDRPAQLLRGCRNNCRSAPVGAG